LSQIKNVSKFIAAIDTINRPATQRT